MTSLHDPLTLPCGQVLPNRIMKAALSEGLSDKQNSPDERLERLYTSWSQGGYGLIVTGNVMVDRTQLGEPGNVVIEDERNLDALSRWAKPPRTPRFRFGCSSIIQGASPTRWHSVTPRWRRAQSPSVFPVRPRLVS